MSKRYILPLTLFTLALVLNDAWGLPDDKTSIVVVDMQRVIDESIIGKAARNNIDGEAKKGQAKLEQLKLEYTKVKADFDKQSALLSGSALDERRDSLDKKGKELERSAQDIREDLMRKNDAQIGKVVADIDSIIKEIAGEHEYQFVFEREGRFVVYADNRIDLSDEVIKTLDKKKVAL